MPKPDRANSSYPRNREAKAAACVCDHHISLHSDSHTGTYICHAEVQLDIQCNFADAADKTFAWRVEEAKLLWAQGQERVAVSISKSLLAAAKHNKQGNLLQYARLLSLTAKWLAQTRYSSPPIPACNPFLHTNQ